MGAPMARVAARIASDLVAAELGLDRFDLRTRPFDGYVRCARGLVADGLRYQRLITRLRALRAEITEHAHAA